MNELNLKLESFKGNELVVRTGTALPLKEPNRVIISGDIRTVGAFLRGRKDGWSTQQIDKSKAFITTDYKAMVIHLQLDPKKPVRWDSNRDIGTVG